MTKNKEPKWKLHAENNKVKPQLEYLATDKLQIHKRHIAVVIMNNKARKKRGEVGTQGNIYI